MLKINNNITLHIQVSLEIYSTITPMQLMLQLKLQGEEL
jgi:hypothetical protein